MTRLTEKIRALDKPCPGMSDGTVGCEFNVNETTVYNKLCVYGQKHRQNKVTN